MTLAWLSIGGGAALLYLGAEGLVRGGAGLGRRAGLSPLAVGLTVVSLATSAPELGVSLQAALAGRDAVAVGNVLGSNVANVGLILGVAAVVMPITVATRVVKADLPLLVAVSGVLVGVLWDGRVGRVEGGCLAAGLAVYVAATVHFARKEGAKAQAEAENELPPAGGPWWLDPIYLLTGLVGLAAGAALLVGGATEVARSFGVSDAVIGLTVVAFGTSLPELAATAVAAARGEGDMAVGNVVGSNIFNSLGIVGVTGLAVPLDVNDAPAAGAAPGAAATQLGGTLNADLCVMLAAAVLLLPLMRTGFRVTRAEGGLLLAGYAGYVAWLFLR